MFATILKYGLIAGLVVGGIDFVIFTTMAHLPMQYGMLLGYATMLLALSAVFVGIKRQRDVEGGGVIRFWPAFGMGVAMSIIASLLYVGAWEASQAVTGGDFPTTYARLVLDQARASGKSAAEIAKIAAEMAEFKLQYAKPMWRLTMIFAEIFPVGLLVSLVSALLLRRPSFMPARAAA